MKFLFLYLSTLLLLSSCKKDPMDPIDPIPPESEPTYYSFQGEIGVNDNSTIVSSDNALLICGNLPSTICLLKVSKAGSQIWRTDFRAGSGSSASGIAQSDNGDIFICGSTYRNELQSMVDVLLVKTNANGDTLWTKTYGGDKNDFGNYILTTDDGNLLICGTSFSYTSEAAGDIYLIKVNTNGDTLWTRTYLETDQEWPYHLMQTQNGDYLITGTNIDVASKRELYLLKVNAEGDQLWDKIIGSPYNRWGFSTTETIQGDLLTCGRISNDTIHQILLVKTDEQGNELWAKEYGRKNVAEQGNAIQVNDDGTFIISGESLDDFSGQRNIVLLKVDQNGNQVIMKSFGANLVSYGKNVLKDDNDDNIITGVYNFDIFITRTDNNCVFK